jgi:putative ABC transport system permease protein
MFETMGQDLRYGVRTLTRNPGYASAAVAVLALGIGSTTAIFSAANAYLFQPLPFGQVDGLSMLYETNPDFGWEHASAAPANVLDWREQVDAFEDVAMYSELSDQVPYVRDGEAELLSSTSVSGNFFSVLGVTPALGRGFTWEETWAGEHDVVVLSHGFWVSHFGADPQVVGRSLTVGATTLDVVGVAPEGFSFPNPGTEFWTPFGWPPENRDAAWFRRAHWVRPVARLAEGVTPEQADAALQVVVGRLQGTYPETNRVMGAGLMPLRDFLVRDVRLVLYVLTGAVGLLLLLACTNVANLNLVRASGRTREVAVRSALGAGRSRLIRQILTEGLVVASLGGVVGLGLGWAGIRALAAKQPMGIEGATSLALDGRVVAFTVAVTLVCGLLATLLPAFTSTDTQVKYALKDAGQGGGHGRGSERLVRALVAVEVALAVLLVVGAGLTARSFWLLRSVDPGFATSGTVAVQFTIPSARYAARDEVLAFQDDFARRLEGRAGVRRVGIVGQLPLAGPSWSSQFQADGWPPDRVGFEILHRRADRGYFEALGIPLVRGRHFDENDGPDAPLVVVINETFARQHFPGEDPLGRRIAYDRAATPESTWYEIVGIVGDQLQQSPGQPARAEVFESRHQDWGRTVWYLAEADGAPGVAIDAARAVLREMDPLIPVTSARALRDVWRASMARDEFILTLLGAFGALALVLAAVGVYGVTAQAARRRTREIGIRVALGAEGGRVVGMMLFQGMTVVAVGLALGVAVALGATRVMSSLLYGVEPTDAPTLVSVVALLAGVAAAACYLPARRATAVDPVRSLRSE